MVNNFSAEWYRVRVQRVIARYGANTKRNKELLALLNDSRLKAIDRQLVNLYQEKADAVDAAPKDPDRWLAYNAAAKAVSDSPWRKVQRFVEMLPLVNMFALAVKSIEVRNLFLEKLKTIDDQNRAAVHSVRKSMKNFLKSLSNDVVPTPGMSGKDGMPESRSKNIPHPLGAILTLPRFYRHLSKEENDEIGG